MRVAQGQPHHSRRRRRPHYQHHQHHHRRCLRPPRPILRPWSAQNALGLTSTHTHTHTHTHTRARLTAGPLVQLLHAVHHFRSSPLACHTLLLCFKEMTGPRAVAATVTATVTVTATATCYVTPAILSETTTSETRSGTRFAISRGIP